MIETHDSIEGSGLPLAFKVAQGRERSPVIAGRAGADVFRVDARALGAHQKEAVVHEGEAGSAWRVTSDEGPYLKGSDLAPFPLGFFNAGLQADLLNRIACLARARGRSLRHAALELGNAYSFSGSFLKGDGRGTAYPARITLDADSEDSPGQLAELLHAAVRASPAVAAMRTPIASTFALYVNGVRRPVTAARASTAPDAPDPFKHYRGAPRPLAGSDELPELIAKIPRPAAPDEAMPSAGARFDLKVLGKAALAAPQGATEVETWLQRPPGSRFRFRTDESSLDRAPSGLAVLSAGIVFCYLTQLLRYTEYLKYRVRAIRVVQYNPYRLSGAAEDWSLAGEAGPVDTHLFLHGEEPDEVMQRLLVMGAQTCYLHAALRSSLAPELSLMPRTSAQGNPAPRRESS
jgi:hypothetical protein